MSIYPLRKKNTYLTLLKKIVFKKIVFNITYLKHLKHNTVTANSHPSVCSIAHGAWVHYEG